MTTVYHIYIMYCRIQTCCIMHTVSHAISACSVQYKVCVSDWVSLTSWCRFGLRPAALIWFLLGSAPDAPDAWPGCRRSRRGRWPWCRDLMKTPVMLHHPNTHRTSEYEHETHRQTWTYQHEPGSPRSWVPRRSHPEITSNTSQFVIYIHCWPRFIMFWKKSLLLSKAVFIWSKIQ